jgi:hypothetical protein
MAAMTFMRTDGERAGLAEVLSMSIEHWRPTRSYTRQEEALLRRLRRTR